MYNEEQFETAFAKLSVEQQPVLRRVLDWGFQRSLDFDPNLQGARVVKGRQTLGLRLGPVKRELDALFHEIGHFIEIDDARICVSGWGLVYGTEIDFGHRVVQEYQSCQGTQREVRVCVIQSLLQEHFGLDPDVTSTLNSLYLIGDDVFIEPTPGVEVPGWKSRYGGAWEKERAATIHQWYAEQRAVARLEDYLNEFERKLDLLEAHYRKD